MTGDVAVQTTVVLPVWDEYVAACLRRLASVTEQDLTTRIVVVDTASEVELPEPNLGLAHDMTRFVVGWDAARPDAPRNASPPGSGDPL